MDYTFVTYFIPLTLTTSSLENTSFLITSYRFVSAENNYNWTRDIIHACECPP